MNDRPTTTEAALSGLPAAIPPPTDLWPGIEARLAPRAAFGDALGVELPRDVAPPHRLWPAIEARLGTTGAAAWPLAVLSRWVAGAAAAAIVGFAALQFHGLGDDIAPIAHVAAPADVWWLAPDASDSMRRAPPAVVAALDEARRTYLRTILAIRGQRVALESMLGQRPDDAAVRALWRYAYQTELRLIDEGGRVITDLKLRYES